MIRPCRRASGRPTRPTCAQALPPDDDRFDAVPGVFGTMSAPGHHRAAPETVRIARPCATVGRASWTPDGFIGRMFRDTVAGVRSSGRMQAFRHASPEGFVAFLQHWYGCTVGAIAALEPGGRHTREAEPADLARQRDRHGDGHAVCLPATSLQTIVTLR